MQTFERVDVDTAVTRAIDLMAAARSYLSAAEDQAIQASDDDAAIETRRAIDLLTEARDSLGAW